MTLEIPPAGTRGARMPGGPLVRTFGGVYAALYRLLGGRLVGTRMLLLSTVGARSGRPRTAPVASFADGAGRWLVAGSAGGAARHPAWFINLAHHPDQVWVEVGPQRFRVTPELLRGEERAVAWRQITARSPGFAGYARRTDREIPVVRLTRAE